MAASPFMLHQHKADKLSSNITDRDPSAVEGGPYSKTQLRPALGRPAGVANRRQSQQGGLAMVRLSSNRLDLEDLLDRPAANYSDTLVKPRDRRVSRPTSQEAGHVICRRHPSGACPRNSTASSDGCPHVASTVPACVFVSRFSPRFLALRLPLQCRSSSDGHILAANVGLLASPAIGASGDCVRRSGKLALPGCEFSRFSHRRGSILGSGWVR